MPQMRYRFGDFELDPASREVWRGGERIALPPKSFECLAYLIAHRDRAVGRDELISAVWGRVEASDTLVAQTLLRARKALGDNGERQAMVRTVPRFGYQWVASVREVVILPGQSESEVAAAKPVELAAPAVEAMPTPRPSRRPSRWAWYAAAVVLIGLLAAVPLWWRSSLPAAPASTTPLQTLALVLPVTVAPAEAETSWVRLGAMDYIASRLRRSGLKVVPSDQTLHLSGSLETAGVATAPDWQRLGQDSGARWILAPEASHDNYGWRVRLEWREAGQARVIEARGNTPLAAAASATDNWLRRQGQRAPEDSPTPLVERLQQIDAELTVGQLATVRRLLEQAPEAQRADPRLQVRQAQLAFRSGQIDQAEQQFLALLGPKAAAAGADVRARTLMGLGAVGIRRGNYTDAQARYGQAVELLQAGPEGLDDPSMLGNAYNGRGVALAEQQQMEAAVHDLGMARIAMQRAGDLVEAAMVGTNLGMIESRRGHYAQGLQELDRAIATYERFGVRDYLAAALSSKAETELALAQPAVALETIQRARRESSTLEDTTLAIRVDSVQALVQIANGRLHDAQATLTRLRALGLAADGRQMAELTLRLLLAQGHSAEALAMSRGWLARADATAALTLLGVQAALRERDMAVARQWQARTHTAADDADAELPVSRALVAARDGDREQALATIATAATRASDTGSADTRIRIGVAQAWILLDARQPEAAAAVLGGDLSSFANSDYRVAWSMLALYRALDDRPQAERARAQAEALRGERMLANAPLL